MVETRTLVVDVDDTISTHINRDYENAIPHTDIIEKLNKMYDSGWKIIYFTARGQISCNGDLNLIEKSRRPALEKWMKKHNVKHHELRFGKPIGVYYIDDKAIRPDEFMNVEYEVLKGSKNVLKNIDYIMTEVNKDEVYKDCAKIEQLDEFLSEFGFKRVETFWAPAHPMGNLSVKETWGDAFYIKTKE